MSNYCPWGQGIEALGVTLAYTHPLPRILPDPLTSLGFTMGPPAMAPRMANPPMPTQAPAEWRFVNQSWLDGYNLDRAVARTNPGGSPERMAYTAGWVARNADDDKRQPSWHQIEQARANGKCALRGGWCWLHWAADSMAHHFSLPQNQGNNPSGIAHNE